MSNFLRKLARYPAIVCFWIGTFFLFVAVGFASLYDWEYLDGRADKVDALFDRVFGIPKGEANDSAS